MQIVIEDPEKAAILKLLVNEDINVLKQAYAYAKNLELYGVDVSEKWETATRQTLALERAYCQGRYDQRNSDMETIKDFKAKMTTGMEN